MFVIIPIPLWQNHGWDILSRHSCFGSKQIQISRHVHRQVTDHNIWYIFIGQSIVCNSKPLFYHSAVPLFLSNVVVQIWIIRFYSYFISHFIHNLFKLDITYNAVNDKYFFVLMSHYYIQSHVALFFCYIGKYN